MKKQSNPPAPVGTRPPPPAPPPLRAPIIQKTVVISGDPGAGSNSEIDSIEMALSTLVAITNMSEDKHVIEMAEQCYLFFANNQGNL